MKKKEYLTDQDIAELLNLSISRLRCKLSAGDELPPRVQLPGCRHRLWPEELVTEWLSQYTVSSDLITQVKRIRK